jgi:Holliday junction resolvase RusA-like endonuclease
MVQHDFFLAVAPKAAARTRATCRGKFAQVYTAPAYREWLEEAIPALKAVSPNLSHEMRERDVEIEVWAYVQKPKTTKRRRPGGDNDNYEKGLWDAMTKVGAWWKDDEQIVDNALHKRWAGPDQEPGYKVIVRFLSPEETPIV